MITKEYLQQELVKRIDGYKRGVETSTDNIVAEMKSILVLVNALPNYEKKYNEALARAKDVKNGPSPHDSSVATVKYIFPELRESDDERIRKFIYDYIADSYWRKDWNVSQEECIAYLEKQKEQKPAEWSEEDNNMWTHLNGYLNGFSCSEDAIKQMADWFYELPDRFNLQPKQEWSEEDEKKVSSLLAMLTTMRQLNSNGSLVGIYSKRDREKKFDEIENWLKSLRPSWKPSEEQMDALKELIDDANRAGWVTPGATELYENLKRL